MDAFETEEQQVEALKKWLNEYGMSIIIGLVLGLGGLFGYRYWDGMEQQHRQDRRHQIPSVSSVARDPTARGAGRLVRPVCGRVVWLADWRGRGTR